MAVEIQMCRWRVTEVVVSRQVTIGVLTSQSSTRSTAIARRYVVWGLNDLSGTSIPIILSGDAYDKYWKEQVAHAFTALIPISRLLDACVCVCTLETRRY
jgi:hypothetical protein